MSDCFGAAGRDGCGCVACRGSSSEAIRELMSGRRSAGGGGSMSKGFFRSKGSVKAEVLELAVGEIIRLWEMGEGEGEREGVGGEYMARNRARRRLATFRMVARRWVDC